MQVKRQTEEQTLKEAWKARSARLWERIEKGIKLEEKKVEARLEEERKKREEEELKAKFQPLIEWLKAESKDIVRDGE